MCRIVIYIEYMCTGGIMINKDVVYFVQDGVSKKIKIGYSSNFKRRYRDLCSSNANDLFVLGVIRGSEEKEREIHSQFSHHRSHGEWFHPTEQILQFIKEVKTEENKKDPLVSVATNPIDTKESVYGDISVSAMAEQVGLSRSMMYIKIEEGIFPPPVYDVETRRPFYTPDLQRQILNTRRTNRGVNGKLCLFYRPRKHSIVD